MKYRGLREGHYTFRSGYMLNLMDWQWPAEHDLLASMDKIYTNRKASKFMREAFMTHFTFCPAPPTPNKYGYYMPEARLLHLTPGNRYSPNGAIHQTGAVLRTSGKDMNSYGWLYWARKGRKLYQREFVLKLARECDPEGRG